MPSLADPNPTNDRIDPYLIDAPTPPTVGAIDGLDAFLADPPLPTEPAPPGAPPTTTPTTAALSAADGRADAAAAPTTLPFLDPSTGPFDLPIVEPFPPETAAPPSAADLGGVALDDEPWIAIANVDFPRREPAYARGAAHPDEPSRSGRGGGGGPASDAAAFPIDDRMLADPLDLLSAAPPAGPTISDRRPSWPSDGPDGPGPRLGAFDAGSASDAASGLGSWRDESRPTADDPAALDRLEVRLAAVLGRLERAAAAASAAGPPAIESRPRGFRGRIDY